MPRVAGVAELADAQDLGSCTERCRGSTPLSCTEAAKGRIMDRSVSFSRIGRPLILMAGLSLFAVAASADTVWVKSGKGSAILFKDIKVVGVQGDSITFSNPAGTQTSRSLRAVPRIQLDDEPSFNAA